MLELVWITQRETKEKTETKKKETGENRREDNLNILKKKKEQRKKNIQNEVCAHRAPLVGERCGRTLWVTVVGERCEWPLWVAAVGDRFHWIFFYSFVEFIKIFIV
jgi:hypothetical protein